MNRKIIFILVSGFTILVTLLVVIYGAKPYNEEQKPNPTEIELYYDAKYTKKVNKNKHIIKSDEEQDKDIVIYYKVLPEINNNSSISYIVRGGEKFKVKIEGFKITIKIIEKLKPNQLETINFVSNQVSTVSVAFSILYYKQQYQ